MVNNVEAFITDLVRIGKSNNTVLAYRTDVEQFKLWLGGTDNSITKVDVIRYVKYMALTKKRSINTINRKIKSIVQYIRFLNYTNVCSNIVDIKEFGLTGDVNSEHKIKIIDKAILDKLKRAIYDNKNQRDIVIYELLLTTAIRSGDLINIDEEDIHLCDEKGKNNYSWLDVRVNKTKQKVKIKLNDDVVTAITQYLKVRPLCKDNKLLKGQRGTLTKITINKLLERYSKQAKIELVTPNMVRHASINNMVKSGMDFETVAAIAGHVSTESTYKYYRNVRKDEHENTKNTSTTDYIRKIEK